MLLVDSFQSYRYVNTTLNHKLVSRGEDIKFRNRIAATVINRQLDADQAVDLAVVLPVNQLERRFATEEDVKYMMRFLVQKGYLKAMGDLFAMDFLDANSSDLPKHVWQGKPIIDETLFNILLLDAARCSNWEFLSSATDPVYRLPVQMLPATILDLAAHLQSEEGNPHELLKMQASLLRSAMSEPPRILVNILPAADGIGDLAALNRLLPLILNFTKQEGIETVAVAIDLSDVNLNALGMPMQQQRYIDSLLAQYGGDCLFFTSDGALQFEKMINARKRSIERLCYRLGLEIAPFVEGVSKENYVVKDNWDEIKRLAELSPKNLAGEQHTTPLQHTEGELGAIALHYRKAIQKSSTRFRKAVTEFNPNFFINMPGKSVTPAAFPKCLRMEIPPVGENLSLDTKRGNGILWPMSNRLKEILSKDPTTTDVYKASQAQPEIQAALRRSDYHFVYASGLSGADALAAFMQAVIQGYQAQRHEKTKHIVFVMPNLNSNKQRAVWKALTERMAKKEVSSCTICNAAGKYLYSGGSVKQNDTTKPSVFIVGQTLSQSDYDCLLAHAHPCTLATGNYSTIDAVALNKLVYSQVTGADETRVLATSLHGFELTQGIFASKRQGIQQEMVKEIIDTIAKHYPTDDFQGDMQLYWAENAFYDARMQNMQKKRLDIDGNSKMMKKLHGLVYNPVLRTA